MRNPLEHIRVISQANRRLYGSPRIPAELQEQGITCARKRVARLMREHGLVACQPQHRTLTTRSDASAHVAPNWLNREFMAARPDEK